MNGVADTVVPVTATFGLCRLFYRQISFLSMLAMGTHAMAVAQPAPQTSPHVRSDLYEKNSISIQIAFPVTGAVIDQGITPVVPINISIASGSTLETVSVTVCESQTGTGCTGGPSPYVQVSLPADGPYQASWVPPPLSSTATTSLKYLAWASVTNAAGESATSSPTIFTYVFPPARVAALTAPGSDIGFYGPASPVLWATFSLQPEDPATVDHVDFMDGATVIGSLRSPNSVPNGYALLWRNAQIGAHALSARGVDSAGRLISTPPTSLYVVPPPGTIGVNLQSPLTGDTAAIDAPILLRATASVTAGKIDRVEFVDGASVIATLYESPYTAVWQAPSIGHHAISARAYDDLGNAKASPAAYVQTLAWPRPPAVVLLAPAQGSSIAVKNAISLLSAVEAGDAAITHVDYSVDGIVVATTVAQPYSTTWTPSATGTHTVTSVAYDAGGRLASSGPASISVTADGLPPPDSLPPSPTVALTLPANDAEFVDGDPVQFAANASQPSGSIARVDFKANGTVIASTAKAPWTAAWTPSVGTYSIAASALSDKGTTSTSATATIRVLAAPTEITLSAPPRGSNFYPGDVIALLPAMMHVSGSVTRLEYYVDGTLIGSTNSAPYELEWDADLPGTHEIIARVYDSAGNTGTSAPIQIAVRPITVHIDTPLDDATVEGSTVAVQGTFEGPANVGIVVNNVIALNDHNGHFFVNDLLLRDSRSTVTATITSMGGSRASHAIGVSRSATTGPAAAHITVSEDEGIDALSTLISVGSVDIANWRVIDLVGGTAAAATGTGDVATLTFDAPGLYTPTVEVTDMQGQVTQKRLVLLVSRSTEVVHAQMGVVNQLFDALRKQRKIRALATMTRNLAGQFDEVYDALQEHWPAIIGSLGQSGSTMFGMESFEAAVTRARDGQKFLYLIEGMRDSDGVWRIDSF
ncbi:MAG: Ig-like domain-containing protein [Casimicrobiaceae bacterium]